MNEIEYSCKVTSHVQRQIELDITYPLGENALKNSYLLDLYIYSPYQLNVNEETYGIERFLGDIKSYTRHTFPAIPLAKLTDPAFRVGPLTRIKKMLSDENPSHDTLSYELRLLANFYQVNLQDAIRSFEKKQSPSYSAPKLEIEIRSFFSDIDRFLNSFRATKSAFTKVFDDSKMIETFNLADEAMSLSTEKVCFKFHDFAERVGISTSLRNELKSKIKTEIDRRITAGYATQIIPGRHVENEIALYRTGVLKKWTDSCMFMDKTQVKPSIHVTQALMSIAAGIAMTAALLLTFFADKYFPTMQVAVLIVLGYIVRDRLKDMLRGVL
ncbi:MAG: hypothetical protein GX811_09025, partial [Lentisphaerae bacterium]|nr:hypothetical protein [Lentisphaerota bacterium]